MKPLALVLLSLTLPFFALLPRQAKQAFRYGRWLLLLAASALVLAPFLWLFAAAFKDRSVLNEYVLLPPIERWSASTLNLNNFVRLFAGGETVQGRVYFWQYLLNSLFFASTSTVLQLVCCSAAGFALAKYEFRGKRWILLFMLGSMLIPSVLLFAPVYQLMVRWGLVDSYGGTLLPGIASVYGIFLFRQAMLSVPNELIDAGRIDGCSELGVYLRLVMPLVRPMSAAFCLVTFLNNWNAFFGPSIFLQTQSKFTLPVILNLYTGTYANDYGLFLAGTLLAIVPPAILFFALEQEFVTGLTSGAVKG